MANAPIWLTGDPEADRLLTEDDNALLIAMILDQQVPMEKAFTGPLVIAQRMGGRLDVAAIAAMPEEEFIAVCAQRPAIHRFPAAMAKRIHQVCRVLSDNYDGQVSLIDAIYYATVTISTTGYGDITPIAQHARIINAIVVTPLRIGFLVLLVGTTLEVLAY